jgi:hypothetical protein
VQASFLACAGSRSLGQGHTFTLFVIRLSTISNLGSGGGTRHQKARSCCRIDESELAVRLDNLGRGVRDGQCKGQINMDATVQDKDTQPISQPKVVQVRLKQAARASDSSKDWLTNGDIPILIIAPTPSPVHTIHTSGTCSGQFKNRFHNRNSLPTSTNAPVPSPAYRVVPFTIFKL